MSMERCHNCGRAIDTDFDAECYVDIGNMRRLENIVPLCEPCRETVLDDGECEDIVVAL